MEKIHVSASKRYDVLIEEGLLSQAGGLIGKSKAPDRVLIVSDETVAELYLAQAKGAFVAAGIQVETFVFKPGEQSKTMVTVTRILELLGDLGFTRKDMIVALGGGIPGDISGFAASCYLRGIRFMQIPTTLLAAVDSSVGGKTGVNLGAGKNLAGAFWQPSLVVCDPEVFKTLSWDIFLDGLGESIKYAMLMDPGLFLRLEAGMDRLPEDSELVKDIILSGVSIKARIVEEDERDTDVRQLLNFGHTFGHAIEKASKYSISHGKAVAMGMDLMTKAAAEKKICPPSVYDKLHNLLLSYGYRLDCPYSREELLEYAARDKKRSGDRMNIVVPLAIGECRILNIEASQLGEYYI